MTPPLAIVFERRAIAEIETVEAWWRANRSEAAHLLVLKFIDLAGAVDAIDRDALFEHQNVRNGDRAR